MLLHYLYREKVLELSSWCGFPGTFNFMKTDTIPVWHRYVIFLCEEGIKSSCALSESIHKFQLRSCALIYIY